MPNATKQKLETKTKTFIVEAIKEVLEDSDFGLELTEKAKKRLLGSMKSPKKRISLSEIKKKYR